MRSVAITLCGGEYFVAAVSSAPMPGYVPLEPAESRAVVRGWMRRREAAALRELLAALGSWRTLSPLDDAEAFMQLVRARFDDHCPALVLHRREPTSASVASSSADASPAAVELSDLAARRPEPAERLRGWIELRLEDGDGRPVPRARYEVLLDDRELRQGYLDQQGFARLEGLPEGNCQVRFPDYDRSSWSLA